MTKSTQDSSYDHADHKTDAEIDAATGGPIEEQPDATVDPALQRDPDEWKTGDEPMTAAQRSYLETLAHDAGEQFSETLTKAEASKRIDELRQRSPRLSGE